MAKMLGIDLGTTNTVVAVVDGTRAKVLDTFEAKPQMRSVVSLKKRKGGNEEILVGDVAFDNWPMAPQDTIVAVKRLMGRRLEDSEVVRAKKNVAYRIVKPLHGTTDSVAVEMGGKQYSPEDISALMLKRVKETAEHRLNETIEYAVITVPAYFSQIQRHATRKAAQMAGLKVINIVDEPTAAAVAFGMENDESFDSKPRWVVVYDLGGGTFDVSVLMIASNNFSPVNLTGDMWLGGEDFDQQIIDHVLSEVKRDYGIDPTADYRFMVELRKAAQKAKEQLSSSHSADLLVSGLLKDGDGALIDVDLTISRSEYAEMIKPLVAKSINLVRDALDGAQVTVDEVDAFLMAGNASMVPLVHEMMADAFGAGKLNHSIHPKHCVAMGAALLAVKLGQKCICLVCNQANEPDAAKCSNCGAELGVESDSEAISPGLGYQGVAPFAYGIQTVDDHYIVFIQKGDPWPTIKQNENPQSFFTVRPSQRWVTFTVYGGGNFTAASQNEKQGEVFMIMPPDLPQGTQIRVLLSLDRDGIFAIRAWLEDGRSLNPWSSKGETSNEVVKELSLLIERFERTNKLNSEQQKHLQSLLDRIYETLNKHEFDRAAELLKQATKYFDENIPSNNLLLLKNTENCIISVLEEFKALIPETTNKVIRGFLDELRRKADNSEIRDEQLISNEINKVWKSFIDLLPPEILNVLDYENAIYKIKDHDQNEAAQLAEKLIDYTNAVKARDIIRAQSLAIALNNRLNDIFVKHPDWFKSHDGEYGVTDNPASWVGHGVRDGQDYVPTRH